MVAAGELQADPAQAELAQRFDDLNCRLGLAGKRSPQERLRRLLGVRRQAPRGLYVHGEVERGKTMLIVDGEGRGRLAPEHQSG
jgi:cell division protein ZapE